MPTLEWLTARDLQVLGDDEAKKALVMNNGYFFGLLDRMISGESKHTPVNTCQPVNTLSL